MKFDFRNELGKITPLIAEGAKIYIFGAGQVYENFHEFYGRLAGVDLDESIDGFIDNDFSRQGRDFHEKKFYSLEEIDNGSSVIIMALEDKKSIHDASYQLSCRGFILRHSFFMQHCFMWLIMRWEYGRLLKFKNVYSGKRCFIIGNAPSLTAGDLNRLKNEITFASNRIYLMFDKTDYRPSYYMIHDDAILHKYHQEISENISCPIFYHHNATKGLENFNPAEKYFYCSEARVDWQPQGHICPLFSEEPLHLYWGATITYDCIQMAAYMGFNEIYLLGIDMDYQLAIKSDGTIVSGNVTRDHFVDDDSYFNSPFCYLPLIDIITSAYKSARSFADSHNIKIYNATRGGKLDIFERVDFEKITKG